MYLPQDYLAAPQIMALDPTRLGSLQKEPSIKEVFHTRVICSPDGDTDHCFVLCQIWTSLKKLHKSQQVGCKRINLEGVKDLVKVTCFLKAVNKAGREEWEDIN